MRIDLASHKSLEQVRAFLESLAADGPHRAAAYRSLAPSSGSLAGRFPLPRSRATIPPVDTAPPKGPPAEEWASITHRFSVGGHIGYISVAADEHGRPVLIEVRMSKAGGLLRGLLDSLAASVTLGLQRGVPLSDYVALLSLARFEPAGWTERMGYAHSVVDYHLRRRRTLPRPRHRRSAYRCSGRRDLRSVRHARHLGSRLALPGLRRHRALKYAPRLSTRRVSRVKLKGMGNEQGTPSRADSWALEWMPAETLEEGMEAREHPRARPPGRPDGPQARIRPEEERPARADRCGAGVAAGMARRSGPRRSDQHDSHGDSATAAGGPRGGALCLGRLGCGRRVTALGNRAEWKLEVHMRQTTNLYPMNGGAPSAGLRLPSPATLPRTSAKLPVAAGRHAVPGATLFPPRQRPLVGTVSKSILLVTPPPLPHPRHGSRPGTTTKASRKPSDAILARRRIWRC